MNLEFIDDLIAAVRTDPAHATQLLASVALADILQAMVRRIQHLEKEIAQASRAVAPGQFMDIPMGVSPQQWQQSIMQQIQGLQALQQDRAQVLQQKAMGQYYLPPLKA